MLIRIMLTAIAYWAINAQIVIDQDRLYAFVIVVPVEVFHAILEVIAFFRAFIRVRHFLWV